MLAVKLHKRKKPWLGKRSFLIPILSWKAGSIQVFDWIKVLNKDNRQNPNNAIRYITLVRIPDEHPVAMYTDWVHKLFGLTFRPLKEHSDDIKKRLMKPLDWAWEDGTRTYDLPEIILGKALPQSCLITRNEQKQDARLMSGRVWRAFNHVFSILKSRFLCRYFVFLLYIFVFFCIFLYYPCISMYFPRVFLYIPHFVILHG